MVTGALLVASVLVGFGWHSQKQLRARWRAQRHESLRAQREGSLRTSPQYAVQLVLLAPSAASSSSTFSHFCTRPSSVRAMSASSN